MERSAELSSQYELFYVHQQLPHQHVRGWGGGRIERHGQRAKLLQLHCEFSFGGRGGQGFTHWWGGDEFNCRLSVWHMIQLPNYPK